MEYIAKTLYQANPEWMIWVTIGECESKKEAEELANPDEAFRLKYEDGGLFLLKNEVKVKTFLDSEVKVEKLKESSNGKKVMEDCDYEQQDIRISDMRSYPGLMAGFSPIGYEVVRINDNIKKLTNKVAEAIFKNATPGIKIIFSQKNHE